MTNREEMMLRAEELCRTRDRSDGEGYDIEPEDIVSFAINEITFLHMEEKLSDRSEPETQAEYLLHKLRDNSHVLILRVGEKLGFATLDPKQSDLPLKDFIARTVTPAIANIRAHWGINS